MFWSGHHGGPVIGELPVVVCPSLGWRDVSKSLRASSELSSLNPAITAVFWVTSCRQHFFEPEPEPEPEQAACSDGLSRRRWLKEGTHRPSGANSTESIRPCTTRWRSPPGRCDCCRPCRHSGSMPASASRSVYRMLANCDPLSWWQTRLRSRSGCRAYRACSRASSAKSVRAELLARQTRCAGQKNR